MRVEVREQRLGQRRSGDACRGLACARSLEHVTGVVKPVLLHAHEVSVPRARSRERLLGLARRGRHLLGPLRPLGVANGDRDRRPERATVADTAQELHFVLLHQHAGASAEAQTPSGQLGRDVLDRDRQPGGQALDHGHERRAVRLAGRQEAQHPRPSLTLGSSACRDTSPGNGIDPRIPAGWSHDRGHRAAASSAWISGGTSRRSRRR
jgi:hypothetical protein